MASRYDNDNQYNNNKGILVSNRPESQLQLTEETFTHIPFRMPFLPCGKAPIDVSHIGLPPAKEDREGHFFARNLMMDKQREQFESNVHVKHKRWLRDFGEAKIEGRLNEIEDQLNRQERRAKFADTQARLRQALMKCEAPGRILQSSTPVTDPLTSQKNYSLTKTLEQVVIEQEKMEREKLEGQKPKATTKLRRPKWAMSEQEAEKALDEEAEDLIKFANSLNFEEFIDDYEVKEALSVIQTKVKAKREADENNEATNEEGQTRKGITVTWESPLENFATNRSSYLVGNEETQGKKMSRPTSSIQHERDWNGSTKVDPTKSADGETTSLPIVPPSLKGIHSKASVNTLLDSHLRVRDVEREKDEEKIDSLLKDISTTVKELQRANQTVPLIVTHDKHHIGLPQVVRTQQDAGQPKAFTTSSQNNFIASSSYNINHDTSDQHARVLLKLRRDPNYVQNLPYLYRCPSI